MTDTTEDVVHAFFPTLIKVCSYPRFAQEKTRMLEAVYHLRDIDKRGQERSRADYSVGYTSYFSETNLKDVRAFHDLSKFLQDKANAFALSMCYDLGAHKLVLSKFWVNINPKYAYHAEHIHAYSVFSGVFYISAGSDSGDLTFKDPREVRLMTLPPCTESIPTNTDTINMPPSEGKALLFPAWLTHSVQQNMSNRDRVSVAYNFRLKSPEF